VEILLILFSVLVYGIAIFHKDNLALSHGTQKYYILPLLPKVQHSGDMFHKNVMKFGERVDVFIAPVQKFLPGISYNL
jgi:hypothetical protein